MTLMALIAVFAWFYVPKNVPIFPMVKVVLWSRGLTWRSQVGANPIPIPQPTNLALSGHKI